jgi:hypothetical protein
VLRCVLEDNLYMVAWKYLELLETVVPVWTVDNGQACNYGKVRRCKC